MDRRIDRREGAGRAGVRTKYVLSPIVRGVPPTLWPCPVNTPVGGTEKDRAGGAGGASTSAPPLIHMSSIGSSSSAPGCWRSLCRPYGSRRSSPASTALRGAPVSLPGAASHSTPTRQQHAAAPAASSRPRLCAAGCCWRGCHARCAATGPSAGAQPGAIPLRPITSRRHPSTPDHLTPPCADGCLIGKPVKSSCASALWPTN